MTLPAAFDFHKHVVRNPRSAGVNASGRFGNHFVKIVDEPDHIVEPGISRFMTEAGVAHAPVSYAHRGGEHLVHSPWRDGKELTMLTPDEAARVSVPHALHTLTAEWLAGVSDRHGGNYAYRDGEVHPLDFGGAGVGMGLTPMHGALMQFLRQHKGVTPSTPLPTAKELVSRGSALARHHASAMAGWPEAMRDEAATRFRRKLAHLAKHDAPPLSHLFEIT